jgi:GT2 family glycosyltransferase
MQRQIAVILVNWNGGADTLACVDSLRACSVNDLLQIIVVDNGSVDDSPEQIAAAFPTITLIRSPHNVGFGPACNMGIGAALAGGASHVFILNNDTVVDTQAIERLAEALDADPQAGIATPKILFYSDRARLWACGGRARLDWGRCSMIGFAQPDGPAWDIPRVVDYAPGAAMMFPHAVLERVGGFDPVFFHSGEDVGLSLRVRALGFRIVSVPQAVVLHRVSHSTGGGDSPRSVYAIFRGTFNLRRKHLPPTRRFITMPLLSLFVGWSMLRLLIIARRPESALAVARAALSHVRGWPADRW